MKLILIILGRMEVLVLINMNLFVVNVESLCGKRMRISESLLIKYVSGCCNKNFIVKQIY